MRTSLVAALFFLALSGGCAGRSGPDTENAAGVKGAPPVALAGTNWGVTGQPVRRIEIVRPCHGNTDLFTFSGAGEVIQLFRSRKSAASGIPHTPPHERASGGWDEGVLRLSGEDVPFRREGGPPTGRSDASSPVSYELHHEAESGNLVGTRNGSPIRLAPAKVTQQGPCGPPPP